MTRHRRKGKYVTDPVMEGIPKKDRERLRARARNYALRDLAANHKGEYDALYAMWKDRLTNRYRNSQVDGQSGLFDE